MSTSKPTSPWKSNDEPDARSEKLEGHAVVADDITKQICLEFLAQCQKYGNMGLAGIYPSALSLMCVSKLHAMNLAMLKETDSHELQEAYIKTMRAAEEF